MGRGVVSCCSTLAAESLTAVESASVSPAACPLFLQLIIATATQKANNTIFLIVYRLSVPNCGDCSHNSSDILSCHLTYSSVNLLGQCSIGI